jgi:2'-5' RNA ligase
MADRLHSSSSPDLPTQARLFLALWPDAGEYAQLLRHLQQYAWPRGASPVKPDRLHLTLHFIGQVARQRLAELGDGLQVAMTPFELDQTALQLTGGAQAAGWPGPGRQPALTAPCRKPDRRCFQSL